MSDDEQPAAPLFRVRDYEGVEVACSIEQWTAKIQKDHPDLTGREQDAADAVLRPAMVLQDRDYADRKIHILRTPTGHLLKVVVVYERDPRTGTKRGRVLTAYLHRRMRKGDLLLYTRSED